MNNCFSHYSKRNEVKSLVFAHKDGFINIVIQTALVMLLYYISIGILSEYKQTDLRIHAELTIKSSRTIDEFTRRFIP